MRRMTLSDGPIALANLGVLIGIASDILHEIEREAVTPRIWSEIIRAQALLGIAQNTCEDTVEAIEAGPDYVFDGGAK